MQNFILFIALATLLSCGQNETKQKEPDLKGRELALKENELNLKEKDTTKSTSTVDTVKIEPNQDTPTQPLILTPLKVSGDIGYVTFSQKGKTVFYYDAKTKRGKIILNGTEYILTKIEGSYNLSGDKVNITTTKGKWEEMVSDCAYGKSLVVTIKMGAQVLQLTNVEVQDCQGMVE